MDRRVLTDAELESLGDAADFIPIYGGDYTYRGRPVCVFRKRSGMLRCVVEDVLGRLFIHSARSISYPAYEAFTGPRMLQAFKPVEVSADCGRVTDKIWYDGWKVAQFHKLSGERRFVVEDADGRLYIHTPQRVSFRREPTERLLA